MKTVILLILGLTTTLVWAQHPLRVSVETGTFISTSGKTPFWQRANQFGTVPLMAPPVRLLAGFSADYDSLRVVKRRITYGYGLSGVFNAGSQVRLLEGYVKIRLGWLEAYAGRRREWIGLVDSTLSTGSYAWSGNALPVPKLQLEVREYTPLRFTKGFVSLKGNFAHGWLDRTGYVSRAWLHQKSLYIRLGKPHHRFHLYSGLNHQVVWGGYSTALISTGLVKRAQLPSDLKAYLSVISGLRSSESGLTDTTQLTDFDLTNRIGNHLGSVDVALEIWMKNYSVLMYRQNPYETGALFYGTSLADGLNGFRIRRHKPDAVIRQVLIEYLNTTSQGGPEFVINDPQRRGRVNYLNHGQFRDGWSYQDQGIGTPFIPRALDPDGRGLPGIFTLNNRVQVWHLGVDGRLRRTNRGWISSVIYQIKLSYSRNKGTYTHPFTPDIKQFSGLLTLSTAMGQSKTWALFSSVSLDQGSLLPQTAGVYLGVRKHWLGKTDRF